MGIPIPPQDFLRAACSWPGCGEAAVKTVTFLDKIFSALPVPVRPAPTRNLCAEHLTDARDASLVDGQWPVDGGHGSTADHRKEDGSHS